jgi:transposase InsO family protein
MGVTSPLAYTVARSWAAAFVARHIARHTPTATETFNCMAPPACTNDSSDWSSDFGEFPGLEGKRFSRTVAIDAGRLARLSRLR